MEIRTSCDVCLKSRQIASTTNRINELKLRCCFLVLTVCECGVNVEPAQSRARERFFRIHFQSSICFYLDVVLFFQFDLDFGTVKLNFLKENFKREKKKKIAKNKKNFKFWNNLNSLRVVPYFNIHATIVLELLVVFLSTINNFSQNNNKIAVIGIWVV
jgi:hypothetical protein